MSDTERTPRSYSKKFLIAQKARQIIYAGDEYDATEVFDESERERAKQILKDYASHPNHDGTVTERARNAIRSLQSDTDQ